MIKNILTIVTLAIFISSCSEDAILKKADLLPGYWQARQETTVFINGMRNNEATTVFYYDFYDDNCGQIFDQNENPLNEIKWAFQERDTIDLLLISTALISSDGSSSDLHMNEISEVLNLDIETLNMHTFKDNERTIDGDEYSFNHHTFFVKQ